MHFLGRQGRSIGLPGGSRAGALMNRGWHLCQIPLGTLKRYSRRLFCRAFLAARQDDSLEGLDGAFRLFGGLTVQVLWDNASLWPHSQFSARGSGTPPPRMGKVKNGGEWRFFEGQRAPFSVLGAGAFEHKPLIWPLLCRPTFLAAQTKKNGGRHCRARSFFDVTGRGG